MYRLLIFLVGWTFIDACVERIEFDIPNIYSKDVVIDGLITNEPGPYTVKLSSVIAEDDTHPLGIPLYAKRITVSDNAGHVEDLVLTGAGEYQTQVNGMQGVVGREYSIRVEMEDGSIFESAPDKMSSGGAVDSVYYAFESYQSSQAPTAYRYRIYMNSHGPSDGDNFFRWKFNGTYVVRTEPKFTHCPFTPCGFCPPPCSGAQFKNGSDLEPSDGYAFNPKTNKVEYVIGLTCTCCRCWVSPREDKPRVSDMKYSSNGNFLKVEMGTIPVNFYTFYERYRVEIVQMSLSHVAFEYWKSIQSQKEAVGSLFQPVTGKIPTNLSVTNGTRSVQGIFYAAAVTKKQIYLDKNTTKIPEIAVPEDDCVYHPRVGPMGVDCRNGFPGSTSTNVQPADWK